MHDGTWMLCLEKDLKTPIYLYLCNVILVHLFWNLKWTNLVVNNLLLDLSGQFNKIGEKEIIL